MTQDANQKNLGIWMVSKYDALGRVIMTGKLTSAAFRSSLQSSADASITSTFESFTNATTNYGYTHRSYPDLTATGGKMLSVNYYDKYDILSNTSVNPNSAFFTAPSTTIDTLEQNPRGLQVAKLVNVLTTNSYLFSIMTYDKDGNVVKTIAQHFQGGATSSNKVDVVENQYSFQGKSTQTIRKHCLSSTSTPAVTIISTPSYDHMNRALLLKQQYNTPTVTGTIVNINKNDYNELGQLITKHLHSTASGSPASSGFLQHVDYRYNSRGWLSRINNSASALDETYTAQLDLFGENLDYDQVTNGIGGVAKYNGNISNIKWQDKWSSNITLPQQYKGYVFTYDAMNRVTNADYKAQNTAENTSYNETMTYDELGNILTLTRKNGTSSTLNSLVYNYMNGANRSNMLTSVSDATGTEAYNSSYTYDTNGNLLTDSKKTITSPVLYNELNLPAQVNITTGTKVLKYTYDATGKRLERLTTLAGATVEDRFYVDGIEYVANVIELIHTPEGRVTPNGANGAYIFEYNIADHLGNVRAVFGDKNNDGVLTSDEILQTTDYYAFGRQINYSQVLAPNPDNTYLFNGKELQKDLGQYDYGARYFDPIIGRWNVVDPMADENRRWSPYQYVKDNPLNRVDPDGMVDFGYGLTTCASCWVESYVFDENSHPDGNWVWNQSTHKVRFDEHVQSAADVRKGEIFVGKTGEGLTDKGYRIFLWADGTWNLGMNKAQQTPYLQTYQAFQAGIRANLPMLKFASNVATGTAYFVSGGVAAGEAAGNFLLGRADRLSSALKVLNGLTKGGEQLGRVFWSGGGNPAVRAAAEQFAGENGMTTLEMTRAGQNLQKLTEGLPWEEAKPMWERMSRAFAEGAQEEVHVFQGEGGVSITSVCGSIEYPILKANDINIIFHIIP